MVDLVVIDDEELEREGIAQLVPFDTLGIRVVGTAKNGREGLALLDELKPAIAITDIRMPVMDGLAMIREAKAAGCETVFVVLSGYGDFDYTSQAMELGIRHYLLKPCDDAKILEVMSAVLAEISARRAADEERQGVEQLKSLLGDTLMGNATATIAYTHEVERGNQAQEVFDELISAGLGGYEAVCAGCTMALLKLRLLGFEIADIATLFEWVLRERAVDDVPDLRGVDSAPKLLDAVIPVLADALVPPRARRSAGDEAVLRAIAAHLTDQNLTGQMLARDVLFMSPDHFGRKVQAITGERFTAFVASARIEAAKQLLVLAPDAKLSTIAELVGFASDEQYFSRTFRKLTGVRPSDYAAGAR